MIRLLDAGVESHLVWSMQSVADHTSGVLSFVAVPTELSDCANRLYARQAVAPLDHHPGSSSFDVLYGRAVQQVYAAIH